MFGSLKPKLRVTKIVQPFIVYAKSKTTLLTLNQFLDLNFMTFSAL